MTNKTNKMRDGLRQRGSTWSYTVHLGDRPAQRCRECDARYWLDRRPRATCACGGELFETMEHRARTVGGFRTRKDAKEARDAVRVKVGQGCDADPGKLTVCDYLRDVWLPSVKDGLGPSTLASYTMHCDRHIIPELGGLKLKALTGMKLSEHYSYLLREGKMNGEGLAPASVLRVRAVMHVALVDAVVNNLLPYNPADAVARRARGASKRERVRRLPVWNREQLRAFLGGARDDRLYPLWYMLSGTGLRRGEALGLKWECLDLEEGTLTVERTRIPVRGEVLDGHPKTENSRRTIKLGPSIIAVIKVWQRHQKRDHLKAGSAWHNTGFVFTNTDGKPLDPRWVSRLFARAVAKVNAEAAAEAGGTVAVSTEGRDATGDVEPSPDLLPPLALHGLRHTYATAALYAGVPVKVVSANLSHANIQITLDFYAHVLADQRDEAAATVDDFMFAAEL